MLFSKQFFMFKITLAIHKVITLKFTRVNMLIKYLCNKIYKNN